MKNLSVRLSNCIHRHPGQATRLRKVRLAAVLILCQWSSNAAAQQDAASSITWKGVLHYSETVSGPVNHGVKKLSATFEVTTPSSTQPNLDDEATISSLTQAALANINIWKNVVITFADSGWSHSDDDPLLGPAADFHWVVFDTLKLPLVKDFVDGVVDLRTRNPRARIGGVRLPWMQQTQVGSKVYVQPSSIDALLDAQTPGAIDGKRCASDFAWTTDRRSYILCRPPANDGSAEGVDQDAMMQMIESIGDAPEGEEDNMVTIMNLKMTGFVEFDGNPVKGTREWTTDPESPGEYTQAVMDDVTPVKHKLTWEFTPVAPK